MDKATEPGAPSGVGVYALVRRLAPICRVHHLSYSFGWALLPFLPWTVGYFEFGRSHDKYGKWNPKWALRLVRKKDFHKCRKKDFHKCPWNIQHKRRETGNIARVWYPV